MSMQLDVELDPNREAISVIARKFGSRLLHWLRPTNHTVGAIGAGHGFDG